MTNAKKIELLAPAKDKSSAILAINYGADAVYIGANAFGARANAKNPIEDIKEVIDYAHKFNAKVYVTINTILTDEELKQAVELIHKLYEIKADAIIIQDMGLLECELPPIEIFASTQCHNDSLEKVQFLEKAGFSRVILARELSLDEIKNISDNTSIEIETFIHGALCVSYSGQCYLSYAIGKRSANKGECAQPCRKKYSLVDNKGNFIAKDKYLLSLKDFNASNRLQDLIDAGVTSFKIEGRLKDENYIKNIISYYRQKLDEIISQDQKASLGSITPDFEPNPEKTFNRGFSEYFLKGRNKGIFSFDTQKAIGEKIGMVDFVSKNYFTLDNGSLSQSDGICFFDNNELKGSNINQVDGKKIYPQNIKGLKKGTVIYRNLDFEFEKKLKSSSSKRKIEAKISITTEKNFIHFEIEDETGLKSSQKIENTFELAQNEEKMLSNIQSQLSKSQDGIFDIKNVCINLDSTPFMPVSKLNEIRRNLLFDLEQKRLDTYKTQEVQIQKTDHDYIYQNLDFRANILNQKACDFYKRHHAQTTQMALESGISALEKKVMTTKHCILYGLNMCRKNDVTPERLFLIDEKGRRYKLNFDCKNCRMEIIF
ncbi:MAG: U32 family peptidase [Candidatus Gastranaerophilales bacterium]|nr:U32 family peptidase [Candidatus Gastranaerophilales bacterium]